MIIVRHIKRYKYTNWYMNPSTKLLAVVRDHVKRASLTTGVGRIQKARDEALRAARLPKHLQRHH